jgi:ribosome-associated toxin RatA of RatAB toxin-antitoxin module
VTDDSMHTEISIDVDRPPRTVFDLARDISRWPLVLPHYRKVTVESRNDDRLTATMAAVRPIWRKIGIPVWWRSQQWADDADADDLRLRFKHVAGATKGMDVTWHIRATGAGSRVTIEHEFTRHLPLLGDTLFPRVVDRLFVRPIAGRTLATFKKLAESG